MDHMGSHQITEITVGAESENLVTYGNQVFVAVESGSQVVVIDTDTNTVTGRIDVGDGPWWLAIVDAASAASDPKLYVLKGSDMSMTVVSLTSQTATASFPCGTFNGKQISPSGLADTRRGGLYVCDQEGSRVLEISATTNTVVDEIDLGLIPIGMVVSADGSRVYVAHPNDKLISVIDTTVTPPAVTRVPVAQNPFWVFLPPHGDRLYMAHWISEVAGLFRVIDLTTMLASSINVHLAPLGLIGDDTRAYVSSGAGKCVDVLDTTTVPPQIVETIPVDGSPGYLAFSADRKTLYANDMSSDKVIAVSLAP